VLKLTKPSLRSGFRSLTLVRRADDVGRTEDLLNSEIVLTAYGAVVVGRRFVFASALNPTWLLALTAATGCAWALINAPRWTERAATGRRPKWLRSAMHVGSVLVLLALFLSGRQLVFLLIGSAFATDGLLGLVSRSITVKGRTGPARAYTARSAIAWSTVSLVFGVLALVVAMASSS
jgi:hypothetical protein